MPAGSQAAIRSGTTSAKEVTVGALNDGAYSFRVTQFTAAGRESAEALRTFVVDTTPPAAPLILTRPTFPSVGDAVFTWTSEPGAYSRWSVVDRSGNAVVSPTDTPVTSATLPSLAEDAYTFGVQQIDAAGNVSPATVEPFTVIAPLVAPAPSNGIVTLLPKQNARRLQPKAGKTLFSRTPVLRWTRGPRGTKLFNLQIFKVADRQEREDAEGHQDPLRLPQGDRLPRAEVQDAAEDLLRVARLAVHGARVHPEAARREQLLHRQPAGAEEEGGAGREAEGGEGRRPLPPIARGTAVRSRGRTGWAPGPGPAGPRAAGSRRPARRPSRGLRASGLTITYRRVSRSRSAARQRRDSVQSTAPEAARRPTISPAMMPAPSVKRSNSSSRTMPVSTAPESLVRRSREAASVSCTDARGGGTARPSRWRMRRFMPTALTRSVGIAAAAAARAVTPARTGSSTSQLQHPEHGDDGRGGHAELPAPALLVRDADEAGQSREQGLRSQRRVLSIVVVTD